MKALVTGGTGFIGSRLVERLLADGADVCILARHASPRVPEGARFVQSDILDAARLVESCRGCDRVFHLAAFVTFDPRQRAELLRVNGEGTANVLAAAREAGVGNTVVASSACTLGLSRSRDHVLDETAQPAERDAARNPYLASKLEAERIALAASTSQPVVVVNPTTVYGPGDWSLNSGTLVLKVARSRIVPVPPGGSNVVDVDDVVDGILAAAERGQPGSRYVLGGLNLTFREIVSAIVTAVGCRPVRVPLPRLARLPMAAAAGFVGRLTGNRLLTAQLIDDLFAFKYYSSERAERELGWVAKRTFEDTVRRAWDFYREQDLV